MSKSPKASPERTTLRVGGRLRAWSAIATVALLTAGCVAGPNFKRPAPPDAAGYTPAPATTTVTTPGVSGGQAQRFVDGAEIPADWWTLFHSRRLNDLIEQALANNHDLKAAEAALTVAHEGVLAQCGAYLPAVNAGVSAVRQRTSAAQGPASTFTLITPQVSVSYAPDVFGLNRRTVEAAQAQEDATRYQLAAAHLTLTSNVTAAAIQQASLDTQIDATRELIAIDAKAVEILRYQVAKGYASRVDLAAQEAQLAQAFGAGAGFWALGAAAAAPIFAGGARKHKERGAKAAYVQASEQYRSAVLTVFLFVVVFLFALDQDALVLL